ncbi:MAG: hypothetical protein H6625_00965 [Bdellovibrionaceae bacterium]|nr:hypothetical protein [Pseudobdellovibrionaceae bacterium]
MKTKMLLILLLNTFSNIANSNIHVSVEEEIAYQKHRQNVFEQMAATNDMFSVKYPEYNQVNLRVSDSKEENKNWSENDIKQFLIDLLSLVSKKHPVSFLNNQHYSITPPVTSTIDLPDKEGRPLKWALVKWLMIHSIDLSKGIRLYGLTAYSKFKSKDLYENSIEDINDPIFNKTVSLDALSEIDKIAEQAIIYLLSNTMFPAQVSWMIGAYPNPFKVIKGGLAGFEKEFLECKKAVSFLYGFLNIIRNKPSSNKCETHLAGNT